MSTPDTANLGEQSDGINLNTALDQMILPPTRKPNDNIRTAYLLKTAEFLQEHPGDSYSIRGLKPHILEGSKVDGDRSPMLATDWYRQLVAPHLH